MNVSIDLALEGDIEEMVALDTLVIGNASRHNLISQIVQE